ncbi:cytochrome c-type biogenesis protein [Vibrio sp. F74]|uniref:cytochrome c-type biogenesis protein n=1 Tax=Vibrio sp. F74 TaxID=700020 RepID=UPI0035F5AEEB
MKKLFVILFSALLMSFTAYAAIDVFEFDNEQQEEQFKELSHTLRCPKCQNNTISDSNAELAKDLRVKVYEMTKAGKSKDEIVDYMIARYGNFVTYKPPFTIATSVLWLGPLFVVLLGFSIIVFNSKKKAQKVNQPKEWDAEKEARLKAILEEKGDKQ